MADYVLPSLGADMESATIVEWQVAPGDAVRKGQVVGMVETEKATMDIEFFRDGVIDEVLIPVGQKVNVGTPLLRFHSNGATAPVAAPAAAAAPAPLVAPAEAAPPVEAAPTAVAPAPVTAPAAPVVPPAAPAPIAASVPVAAPAPTVALPSSELVHRIHPPVEHLAHELGIDLATVNGSGPGGRVMKLDVRAAAAVEHVRAEVTPRARRLAEERGIDLALVSGTGPDGSITYEDVERAAVSAEAPVKAPEAPTPPVPPEPEWQAEPVTPEAPSAPAQAAAPVAPPIGESPAVAAAQTPAELAAQRQAAMRHAIAVLMARSKREIPHYYLTLDIDMSRPLAWLAEENARRAMADRLLSAALLVKATALALREIPEMNGFWVDDKFVAGTGIHPGIAISLRAGGLVAPAIHDADQKTLAELMAATRDLVARARTGSLHRAEMADPTITITNLGDQGVDSVHGVIYPPQVALVGFGRVRERPVAVDGLVGARPVMTATLAADHRNSDGHRGGLFLAAIERHLQEPQDL